MYKEKWYHSPWLIGILTAFWFLVIPIIIAILLLIQRQLTIKKLKKEWEESGLGEIVNLKEKLDFLGKEV